MAILQSTSITGSLEVTGSLNVTEGITGDTTINGSLGVTGSIEVSNPLTSSQYVKIEYNQSDDYRTRLTIDGPRIGTWDGGGEIMLRRSVNNPGDAGTLLLSAFGSTGDNTPHIQSSGTEIVFADSLNPNSNGGYDLGSLSRRWKTLWGNNLDIKSISTTIPTVTISGSNSLTGNYALKVVNSSGTDILAVQNDGKVGINISNPSYDLHLPTSAVVKIGNLIIDANGTSGAGTQMLSGGSEISIGSNLIPQPKGYNLGSSGRYWGNLYIEGDIYGYIGNASTPNYWGFLANSSYRDDFFYRYLPPLVSFAIGNTPSTYRGYFGLIQPSGSDSLDTDAVTKFGLFVIGPGGRTILGKTQYNRTNDSIPADKMFTLYDGETSTNELFYIATGSGNTHIKGNVSASTYYGDGSNLTGINTGSWDGIFTGSVSITGSLVVQSSEIDFTSLPTTDPGVVGRLFQTSSEAIGASAGFQVVCISQG